jgi:hypothetical protein
VTYPDRWQDNAGMVAPPGAVPVEVRRRRRDRRALRSELRGLPAGTPVLLLSPGLGGGRRCRALARDAGIQVEREYVAFPSARAPAYLVEDAAPAWRYFVRAVLATPPRVRFPSLFEAAVRIARGVSRWPAVRGLSPGRVVVGRRT